MTTAVEFDSKTFVKTLPQKPGVYQMYDGAGKILYVGKAKNLKNRVASYFRNTGLSPKTQALVARIRSVQVTLTETEVEALLLEQSLIKAQRPPYNILLRDDKSYPYILLTDKDDFPRIVAHRGSKRRRGSYFGPFPNASAVHQSIQFLQKTFKLRSCEDSVFANRSRPCLQYQIGRCSGSCVGLISKADYACDLNHAVAFLKGQNSALIAELADQMEQASANLAFERAALLRDQIAALKKVQSESTVDNQAGDVDVIGAAMDGGRLCVHFLFVRAGRIQGSRSFFVNAGLEQSQTDLLLSFLAQWYLAGGERDWPREILLPEPVTDVGVFEQAVSRQAGKKIVLSHQVRAHRAQWQQLASQAAAQNLASESASKANMLARFEALQQVLTLPALPERLECFDISHTGGERTLASCVVFNREGAFKSDYRRFNIDNITPGDDYAAMTQALTRRYTRVLEEGAQLPDLLIVDGGKGQLAMAREVLAELGLSDLPLLGIAKGTTRKAGFETLLYQGREFTLDSRHPALHLLQAIRDESHRFAITGHKQRRDKARKRSRLEDIEGVGPKRRRELLRHFGGLQGVQAASVADLEKVPGISKKLAEDVYSAFNSR